MRWWGLMLLWWLALSGCQTGSLSEQRTSEAPAVVERVPAASQGFLLADAPRPFSFPEDHGQHPGFQTEWWYYTGHLRTASGRTFGMQVTFFRRGLVPASETRTSVWATEDVYLAHFCISDLEAGKFYQAERLARGAAHLAGASTDSHDLFLLDWRVTPIAGGVRMQLADPAGPQSLDLEVMEPATAVLHGDSPGWSFKGGPQQASYYYSYPRMSARGTLQAGEERHEVSGTLWMDHEWGSNQLASDQQGWDWFALQLDDGSAVMLFQIRPATPGGRTVYSGTRIPVSGEPKTLGAADFTLTPRDWWTSPVSGGKYPLTWEIAIPSVGVAVTVASRMSAQELRTEATTGITYWEGSVGVQGSHPGEGYLEMTGYVENVGVRF